METVHCFFNKNRKNTKSIRSVQGLYLLIKRNKFYLVKNNIIQYNPNGKFKYLVNSKRFLKYLDDNCKKQCYCIDCLDFNPLMVNEIMINETIIQSYHCPALGFKVNPCTEKNCNCYAYKEGVS